MQIVFARRNFRSRHPSTPGSHPAQTNIHLHVSCKYSISSSFQILSRLSTVKHPSTRLYQAPTPIGCSLLKSVRFLGASGDAVFGIVGFVQRPPACCIRFASASSRIRREAVNGEANISCTARGMQHLLGSYFMFFASEFFGMHNQCLADIASAAGTRRRPSIGGAPLHGGILSRPAPGTTA